MGNFFFLLTVRARGFAGIYIKSGEGNGGDTWWDSGVIQKVWPYPD